MTNEDIHDELSATKELEEEVQLKDEMQLEDEVQLEDEIQCEDKIQHEDEVCFDEEFAAALGDIVDECSSQFEDEFHSNGLNSDSEFLIV